MTYDLAPDSFLLKAAVFLLKGEIDKRIEQFTKLPLQEIIQPVIENLNKKLVEFDLDGLEFVLKIDSLLIQKLEMRAGYMQAEAELKANQALA